MAKEKDIRYQANCSICSNKLGFVESGNVHVLCDGTLCQKCNRTLHQLLDERKWWGDTDEFNALGLQANYDFWEGNCMPLKEAQALLALRDRVSTRFLGTVDLNEGNVFVIQETFAMPKSPPIFILRAMKLKNKAVLQGFPLKGTIKKGDRVRINVSGTVRDFTALDVIPRERGPLVKDTFYTQLEANVHNHKVPEGSEGWIIIDTEEIDLIPKNTFAATYK